MFAMKGSTRIIHECRQDIVMTTTLCMAVDTLYSIDADIGIGLEGIVKQETGRRGS